MGTDGIVYEFGGLLLDPAERLLLRNGRAVPLTPKAFDLLVCLVERHGRLVEKDALIAALWPDTLVEEANLAVQISALRKALGDGGEYGTFIETIPTRGYRFVAPVVERRRDAPRGKPRRRIWPVAAIAVLSATTGAMVVLWTTGRGNRSDDRVPRAPVFRQLTATPAEDPVSSQAISPDGKYLAYSGRTAIHVVVVASGDTQTLPDTAGMQLLGWNDDSTQIRAMNGNPPHTIWDISLVGGARRRSGIVWPDNALSMTPDGSSFLTSTAHGDFQIAPLRGTPRTVLNVGEDRWYHMAVWTPDSRRGFILRGFRPEVLETFAVRQGGPSVVLKAPRGQGIRAVGPPTRDGRLVVLTTTHGIADRSEVWEIHVNPETGLPVSEPRRLTDWREVGAIRLPHRATDVRWRCCRSITTWMCTRRSSMLARVVSVLRAGSR